MVLGVGSEGLGFRIEGFRVKGDNQLAKPLQIEVETGVFNSDAGFRVASRKLKHWNRRPWNTFIGI